MSKKARATKINALSYIPGWLADKVAKERKTKGAAVCAVEDKPKAEDKTEEVKALPAPSDNSGKGTAVIESEVLSSTRVPDIPEKGKHPDWFVPGYDYLNDQPLNKSTGRAYTLEEAIVFRAVVKSSNLQSFMRTTILTNSEGWAGRPYPITAQYGYFYVPIYENLAVLKYFERDRVNKNRVELSEELYDYLWEIPAKEGQVG